MSPKTNDVTVTIRAVDEVTPVLKSIRRELWWVVNGPKVLFALFAIVLVSFGFLIGYVVR